MAQEIATSTTCRPNLKAYYRFENGALTTDSSGNSHTLSAISDPAEDTSGVFGSGIALDGNDAYSATDHADFKPTGNFTVGAWFKTSYNSASNQVFLQSWSANTDYAGIMLLMGTDEKVYIYSGKNSGTVLGTDYQIAGTTATYNDGNWHFAVGTWDSSKLHIYIDGAEIGTGTSWANAPSYAATNYVRVGCQCNAGINSSFLNGSLDDVFLLNGTALSSQEIADIYNGSCNKFFQLFN